MAVARAAAPLLALAALACDAVGVLEQGRTVPRFVVVRVDARGEPLLEGDTTRMRAEVRTENGMQVAATITWRTRDGGIARVDGEGLVTAVGDGTTAILAEAAGGRDSAVVVVLEPVVTVRITREDAVVTVGDTVQMAAVLVGVDGGPVFDRRPRWGSFDPAIASISKTGAVRGQNPGVTRISARIDGAADTVEVRVSPPEPFP